VSKQDSIRQYEGTYFTRYVPEKKCSSHTIEARKTFKKEVNKAVTLTKVTQFKFAVSTLLIFFFMIGIAVSLYVYATSSTYSPSSLDAEGLVLVSSNASSTKAVLNVSKQQSKQEWMAFANQHQLKTVTCAWEQLAKCQQRYPDWMFVVLAE
jgi:cell division septal protein FtsQ